MSDMCTILSIGLTFLRMISLLPIANRELSIAVSEVGVNPVLSDINEKFQSALQLFIQTTSVREKYM